MKKLQLVPTQLNGKRLNFILKLKTINFKLNLNIIITAQIISR
jgi:hypothetical protein